MNYIIFDLEWNNAYSYAKKGFMNEIIEIGAVKLNERLEIVDTFKQLILPKITKKLSGRCKSLTNITNEELKQNGIPFADAIKDFSRWSRGDGNVFMSWSNSDLYVLTNNYQTFLGNLNIDFITKYCDAQKYCMSFIKRENNNQISLADCGETFGIEIDVDKLHRALTDCYLTAECLKKVFDKDKLQNYIHDCDSSFFERLIYKPYLIVKPVTQLFDVYKQDLLCPVCKSKMVRLKDFECVNKSFRCPAKCKKCGKTYWTTVRAKKTYDTVEVNQRSIEMNRKKAKRIKKD
ncbi:3'-5' exonuclease [uncultured Eubacterium sp.]|uniref:3'-5' exonuclease n=1 Tax=uncultured Eubacterium sp. TaxID=165185 RepID=UPI0026208C4F|nr:3'-5' exonuclease [uncultured Eubacterium sp.]